MTVKINLASIKSNKELLNHVVRELKLNTNVKNLDELYNTLLNYENDVQCIFVNRSKITGDLAIYFNMLQMAIEDATENKERISVISYFDDEPKNV